MAHQMDGQPFILPWASFAEFYESRFREPAVSGQNLLSYYDDERNLHRIYTYAEFDSQVRTVASSMQELFGVRRGDRIATVLFNHDQTVFIYFAAWLSGAAVVPINAEEPLEKKRYILEHSEASVCFCWQDYADEIGSLLAEIDTLALVVSVGDETHRKDIRGQGGHDLTLPRGARRSTLPPRACQDRLLVPKDGAFSPGQHETGQPGLQDEAVIVYTSGTTGPPKGVILTAENLLMDADGITAWHGFGTRDRLMCVLPIHHVNGTIVTLLTPFYCQGGMVLNRKFKTSSFWRRIHEEEVTCVSVVPTLLEFLLEANEDLAPYRLDRFKGLICGAGPLLKETAARFEDRFGFPIRHGYGLSETTCYSSFLPNDLSAPEHRRWLTGYDCPSIGLPIRHNEMAILDARGQEVAEGNRGEICIRGRTVCSGYFKRPDANEAAFRDGWFRSGDEGFCIGDEHGRPFFFISGRLKELIIRGGVNISPLEIDEVLKGHPAVKFAMAIPFENRFYGEEIAAYIVPREGHEPTESLLLEFCRSRLAFAKRPKVILFGREVPYTATGKPKRLELKNMMAAALAQYRDVQFKERPPR
ncbi:MAG TPA: class I adenylate-forming enzyme family protein [Nitrospirales bacterium]